MGTIIISGITGCYRELVELLNKANLNPVNDTLIFNGNLIDHGDNSFMCYKEAKRLNTMMNSRFVFVRGLQEELFMNGNRGLFENSMWVVNGGKATKESFKGHLSELDDFRNFILKKAVFVYEDPLRRFAVFSNTFEEPYLTEREGYIRSLCQSSRLLIIGHDAGKDVYHVSQAGQKILTEGTYQLSSLSTGVIEADTGIWKGPGFKLSAVIIKNDTLTICSVPYERRR